jgi:hypothetical protein
MNDDDILDQMRALYEGPNGDDHKAAIPAGLAYCIANDLPIPPWLRTAFGDALQKVGSRQVKTWDDVFGRPVLKSQRIHTMRRNVEIAGPLFAWIRERRGAGASITKELFGEGGAKFGVGATVAEEIYYNHKRSLEIQEETDRAEGD